MSMLSPKKQQIDICLVKSGLEDIENKLVLHRSTLPILDEENEQKYRETVAELKIARSLNTEIERLKLENVKLTAKRVQLKQQCEDIGRSIEIIKTNRNHLQDSMQDEENEIEKLICQYEDSLKEIAERFRKTRHYYNKEDVMTEYNEVISSLDDLELQYNDSKETVEDLKKQLQNLQSEIPEDMLNIVGTTELGEKIQELSKKCTKLTKQKDYQRNQLKDPLRSALLKF